jgi:hypothetical protein
MYDKDDKMLPVMEHGTIALIDTRAEVPQETVGTVISTHATMLDAFKGNDAFQRDSGAIAPLSFDRH